MTVHRLHTHGNQACGQSAMLQLLRAKLPHLCGPHPPTHSLTCCLNFSSVKDPYRCSSARDPLHLARHAACGSVIPSRLTSSRGRQQSSICSWNQRHEPFQVRLGSMASAFSTMARLASPQKAGSSWVLGKGGQKHGQRKGVGHGVKLVALVHTQVQHTSRTAQAAHLNCSISLKKPPM